jgi:hypothetical protein
MKALLATTMHGMDEKCDGMGGGMNGVGFGGCRGAKRPKQVIKKGYVDEDDA